MSYWDRLYGYRNRGMSELSSHLALTRAALLRPIGGGGSGGQSPTGSSPAPTNSRGGPFQGIPQRLQPRSQSQPRSSGSPMSPMSPSRESPQHTNLGRPFLGGQRLSPEQQPWGTSVSPEQARLLEKRYGSPQHTNLGRPFLGGQRLSPEQQPWGTSVSPEQARLLEKRYGSPQPTWRGGGRGPIDNPEIGTGYLNRSPGNYMR